MVKNLSYLFTFASPGNKPGFNCSEAGCTRDELSKTQNSTFKTQPSKPLRVMGVAQ